MNNQDPRIFLTVPDPNLESDFWSPTHIGMGRKSAVKAHEAMRRARHCATTNNKRRLSAHLRTYDRLLHGIAAGRNCRTVLLTRKDVRPYRHKAVFGATGTGGG